MAAPNALAPMAPRMDVHSEPKPNATAHALRQTLEPTMQPESRKFVNDTAMVLFLLSLADGSDDTAAPLSG